MKKTLLSIIVIHIFIIQTYCQRPWSILISNTPRIEHRDLGIKNLLYYPISPSIGIDYNFTDRFSLLIGTFLHFDKDKDEAIGIPDRYFILKTSLYEVPFQFNYNLKDKSKIFVPFIKTAIRYSFYHLSATFHDNEDITTTNYNDSYILWDFGAGINFKIKENFFLRGQASYGLGLKHVYKDFKYFEPLIGLGYTFN